MNISIFVNIIIKTDKLQLNIIKNSIMYHCEKGLDIPIEEEPPALAELPREAPQVTAMIRNVIEQRVRPMLQRDGGDVVYRGFDPKTGIVYVSLKGACSGCPSSEVTLKEGIERMVTFQVVEVSGVQNLEEDEPLPFKVSQK